MNEALMRVRLPVCGERCRHARAESGRSGREGNFIVREAPEAPAARLFATIATAEEKSELQRLADRGVRPVRGVLCSDRKDPCSRFHVALRVPRAVETFLEATESA